MRKACSCLLATLFLAGCPNIAVRSSGEAALILRPSFGNGSYATKTDVPVYSKDTINHLVLKLFTLNAETETPVLGSEGEVSRDVLKVDLDSSIVIGNLKANTTYRIRGYAYKAAGTNSADLISDASSYTDVLVETDDRPTMAAIPVKLVDRNFAGTGTSSFVVTPGSYSYSYAEGMPSYYNNVYRITTVAGGVSPENSPATIALLNAPKSVACDGFGNFFIVDNGNFRVRKVTAGGIITTIAGNGTYGFFGDKGPATAAQVSNVNGIALDGSGAVYFADSDNNVIRKVGTDGIITTVAGNGTSGFDGDGGPATAAQLKAPLDVCFDGLGAMYIVDWGNNRIRKVAPNGTITTVAGNGATTHSGDGGQATAGPLGGPNGAAVDGAGALYISEAGYNRIRKVAPDGTITTIAGDGTSGFEGDGGPATSAQLATPTDIALAGDGSVLFIDSANKRIRKVAPDGTITTIAGNGTESYNGDGGPATSAQLYPTGIAMDTSGNLLIADFTNHRIRKVASSVISTVAGCGTAGYRGGGYYGEGGLAVSAWLKSPTSVFARKNGKLLIADNGNCRLREIGTDGRISTIAGNGTGGFTGDGGQATEAQIYVVHAAEDTSGNLYISGGFRVRKVGIDGIITTIAGNGTAGYLADGVQATTTTIRPFGIAVNGNAEVFIAEGMNKRVRKVGTDGIITTFAGNGTPGYTGDGGPATAAQLNITNDVLADAFGNLYIADTGNQVIRKVDKDGIITTIAGNGTLGYNGDGIQATAAQLYSPSRLALDDVGNLYILDGGNNRIRKVSPNGIISTIAGPWTNGFSGDNGPANSAQLNGPNDIAVDRLGNVYVSDNGNHAVRKLD